MCRDFGGRSVLLTGATGFIGQRLVSELLSQGARLRVLVRGTAQIPSEWATSGPELYRGDLQDPASLVDICNGVETVFHAAGHAHVTRAASPNADILHWQVNAEGTRRLLESAGRAGVKRFVFLSSVKAMGEPGQQCIDEDWPVPPETAYGKAKRAAELSMEEASARYGMHTVVLRLALVYGPGVKGNLERMAAAIRRGVFPPLPEVGNKRSMVHVVDVVRAALHCADDPRAFRRTYIVTDGHPYSGREIYRLLCRAVGRPVRNHGIPVGILKFAAAAGDAVGLLRGKPLSFDSEALDKLLGWACYRCDRIQLETGFRPLFTLEQSMPEILMNDEPREC